MVKSISGYEIFLLSPRKHFASDAAVCPAAIIRGLLFPSIVTSSVGRDKSTFFWSNVMLSSSIFVVLMQDITNLSTYGLYGSITSSAKQYAL